MRKRGRPKSFDPDEVLDIALTVFWTKGYDGASLTELTRTMGISRPALYDEFGSKEGLFRLACLRYVSRAQPQGEGKSVREQVEAFFLSAADSLVHPEHAGCLLVTAGLSGGESSEGARQALYAARIATVNYWRQQFERAVESGELPPEVRPDALARYVMAVATGMSVQARTGATVQDLRDVSDFALANWPLVATER